MKNYLLITLLTLAACSSEVDVDQQTFKGKYKLESGHGTFYPEGIKEKWLVETGINNIRTKNDSEKSICFKNAVFEGQISNSENFGYDENFNRSFTITQIIKETRVNCRDF